MHSKWKCIQKKYISGFSFSLSRFFVIPQTFHTQLYARERAKSAKTKLDCLPARLMCIVSLWGELFYVETRWSIANRSAINGAYKRFIRNRTTQRQYSNAECHKKEVGNRRLSPSIQQQHGSLAQGPFHKNNTKLQTHTEPHWRCLTFCFIYFHELHYCLNEHTRTEHSGRALLLIGRLYRSRAGVVYDHFDSYNSIKSLNRELVCVAWFIAPEEKEIAPQRSSPSSWHKLFFSNRNVARKLV